MDLQEIVEVLSRTEVDELAVEANPLFFYVRVSDAQKLLERNKRLQAIVQRIASAHWDMKACECWVCREARAAGIEPIHEMLSHIGSNRTERPVPVDGWGTKE